MRVPSPESRLWGMHGGSLRVRVVLGTYQVHVPIYQKPSKMVGSSVPDAELRRRQALLQVEIARLRADFTQQLDALLAQTERLTAALQDAEGPPKGKKGIGGRKAFQPRESVLSVMMRDENYQTIYHVAVAIVAWSVVRVVIEDTGIRSTVLDLGLLERAFLRLDSALCIWCVLAAVSFFVLPIAHIVASASGVGKHYGAKT